MSTLSPGFKVCFVVGEMLAFTFEFAHIFSSEGIKEIVLSDMFLTVNTLERLPLPLFVLAVSTLPKLILDGINESFALTASSILTIPPPKKGGIA